MAMVGSADKPSIGSVEDVCKGFFVFNDLMQQAAIDLKLLQETLPKPIHNAALLAGLRKRFGADRGTSIGPSSQRGVAFRQWSGVDYNLPRQATCQVPASTGARG
mmetsp:Transcript_88417/g.202221  ORF Transcript_88417/g.202221 Transcript_88417/m.202221 type:complete len:105 (-) Transcript_88417:143-457(-)